MQNENIKIPFFSVIIPVYNVIEYLEQCVESVLLQDFSRMEIILIDDGSTDGSGKLCDKLAQKDNRIAVVHQQNQGLPGARNSGIGAATGEWLIFLDSDDFWQKGFLTELYLQMEKNYGYKVYIGRFLCLDRDGNVKKPTDLREFVSGKAEKGSLKERFMWYNGMVQVSAWKMAVDRNWLKETGLTFAQDVKYAEDVVWSLQIFQLNPPIYYVDIPFVIYRMGRQGSITNVALPFKNFEARIAAWRHFINGGKYSGDASDNSFAQSFTANKVVGEFQNQVNSYGEGSEQREQAIKLMQSNIEAAKCIRVRDVSLKRYAAAKLLCIVGPYKMSKIIGRYSKNRK